MPKILDDCVKDVQSKIDKGELPKGSNAWAVCISRLRQAGLIIQKGKRWILTEKGKKHQTSKTVAEQLRK